MQHHNYHMNECHESLLKNSIQASTVKADAFTISECDLEKAKQLLNFEVGISNWRVSKTEDIKFPYVKLDRDFSGRLGGEQHRADAEAGVRR